MDATGGIGIFVIVGQSGIGSGIRRIEALTGIGAEMEVQRRFGIVDRVAATLRVAADRVLERTEALLAELETKSRRATQLEEQVLRGTFSGLAEVRIRPDSSSNLDFELDVDGAEIQVQVRNIPATSVDVMRRTGDYVRDSMRNSGRSGLVVLGSVVGERPVIIVMATSDIAGKVVHAGNIAKGISATIGGGGGGRPDSAQAGARDATRIDEALRNARSVVESLVGAAVEVNR